MHCRRARLHLRPALQAAARLLNERSPRSPTASPPPGSPRVLPPACDPPVPEMPPLALRTALADEGPRP